MSTLPPEEELAPNHDLGDDPTDEDVPTPELDDYDQEPEPALETEEELEDVAIPKNEDDGVEAELGGDE